MSTVVEVRAAGERRGIRGGNRKALIGVLVAGLVAAGCSDGPPDRSGPIVGADGSDLFTGQGSVWNQAVPADAPVDPRSAEYVAVLTREKAPVVSVNGWTVPVYDAGPDTPRYRVVATGDVVDGGWALPAVPIPDAAAPDGQEDGHLVIVDRTAGCVYEMREAQARDDVWTARWINATPVDGTGVYPDGLSARGAGLSAAAGLIWPQELAAGRIDHALLFAFPDTRLGVAVPPATGTDGRAGPDVGGLPTGARLRLDPAVDVDALGLTPELRTIAVALQEYGMIVGGTSGGFTLYAAGAQAYETFPYPQGWAGDIWADIKAIPFDRMQVLALPAPSPPAADPPVLNRCTQDAQVGGAGPGSMRPPS